MKKSSAIFNSRRLLATSALIILFILYLVFDIDFLIAFDVNDNAETHPIAPISVNDTNVQNNTTSSSNSMQNKKYGSRFRQKPSEIELQSMFDEYGFDRERWHQWRLSPRHCPYFENICVHRQHFYVFDEHNAFKLYPNATIADIFGFRTKNAQKSLDIFRETLNARVWNQSINEYESSQCTIDSSQNHIILSGIYLSMMGEFYLRILTALHWIFNEQQMMDSHRRDYNFYLMLPEFSEILLSHRIFLELYTKNEVLSYVNLFEHYRCKCYKRLFFCGFSKITKDELLYLEPKEEPLKTSNSFMNKLSLFHKMIDEYHFFIDHKLGIDNIKKFVLEWKQNALDGKYGKGEKDASKWKFIGFYQRIKRRRWSNLRTCLQECNKQYNAMKIMCVEVNLEGFIHANELIIMHRSLTMLIGIHGATLTDAVFMENGMGNYIIELLPFNGPDWTSSLDQPTLSGVLFWRSKYNYVGMKLGKTSMIGEGKMWYDQNFNVNKERLMDVIDFLMIDDGGYCKKFKRADKIQIPTNLKSDFAIYNAYCPQTPDIIYSYVKPRHLP